MANTDKPIKDDPEVQMPNVGEPVREKSAGKWLIWFVAILAAALIISFLV